MFYIPSYQVSKIPGGRRGITRHFSYLLAIGKLVFFSQNGTRKLKTGMIFLIYDFRPFSGPESPQNNYKILIHGLK